MDISLQTIATWAYIASCWSIAVLGFIVSILLIFNMIMDLWKNKKE